MRKGKASLRDSHHQQAQGFWLNKNRALLCGSRGSKRGPPLSSMVSWVPGLSFSSGPPTSILPLTSIPMRRRAEVTQHPQRQAPLEGGVQEGCRSREKGVTSSAWGRAGRRTWFWRESEHREVRRHFCEEHSNGGKQSSQSYSLRYVGGTRGSCADQAL